MTRTTLGSMLLGRSAMGRGAPGARRVAARCCAPLMLLALLLAGGAAAAAAAQPHKTLPFTTKDQAAEVRRVYQRLADYAAADPDNRAKLSFELSAFTTVQAGHFGDMPMINAITMPGGNVIDATRADRTSRPADTGTAAGQAAAPPTVITFLTQWTAMEGSWLESPEGVKNRNHTLRDLLAALAASHPELDPRSVEVATSYQVKATLGKRQRTYRAAFLWLSPPTESLGIPASNGMRFIVIDHITSGVAEAAAATDQIPAAPAAAAGPAAAPEDAPVTCAAVDGSASPVVVPLPFQSDTFHHTTLMGIYPVSEHHLIAKVGFTCGCTTSCLSTCTPAFIRERCEDVGAVSVANVCHHAVAATSFAVSPTGYPKSITTGGSCGASVACDVRECTDCTCGVTVSTTISLGVAMAGFTGGIASTVAQTDDPNAIFRAGGNAAFECPPCVQTSLKQPPPPPGCTDGCNCPNTPCPAGSQCLGHPGVCTLCGTGSPCLDLGYSCGVATECGLSIDCGTCQPAPGVTGTPMCVNGQCFGGDECLPCDNQPEGQCGEFFSSSCNKFESCDCEDPTTTCSGGICVPLNDPGEPDPGNPDCNGNDPDPSCGQNNNGVIGTPAATAQRPPALPGATGVNGANAGNGANRPAAKPRSTPPSPGGRR